MGNNVTILQYQLPGVQTEIYIGGINHLIDTLNNDNDIMRFTIILKLCFMLIKGYGKFIYYIVC
jgi:hypothetical protein